MRIMVYEAGKAPAMEWIGHIHENRIDRREQVALVKEGIWEDGMEGVVHNWLKEARDGSVWAGGRSGKVAKVRGKCGRRLAGRDPLPKNEKRKTTSIQLANREREKLETLAARATAAEGKRVTISNVVERLVRRA